ncbi:carboxymuconolactone decarboxylase [Stenotrophomonas sp. ESTM1D_MKCIP4_1]|uniref:carboxymuconolactone decarboxylase family protein n=1 Tax=Stenotrophomonas sp. ESTM1D_MKCIP4_1 TaxID=2072414 RepID=UPI000D541E19|nr:carboxymuconolactone decarboxylase family protein [Stenotrophomonas sp. ESTM1D_MKCIP4_1]AWH53519.1 carboxymuconolactone decarboxylase [Stenotrophomonas sp. ESTM1D_MKCIP4_1]
MNTPTRNETTSLTSLSPHQQALALIAAFAASGNAARLKPALEAGLNAGLSVSDVREVLLQLYAYAGFPRSLNALGELMGAVEARKARGLHDDPGRAPSTPALQGDALLKAGTANQTLLAGGPVAGPLFDFAPDANTYLRTHLFGDIFQRDNLDWQTREVATVSMLSMIEGTDPQLQAHIRMSMNIGVGQGALLQLADVLDAHVADTAAQRVRKALEGKAQQ